MTEELLDELTQNLLEAYRVYLEAQRAYYGREAEVDKELEAACVDADSAYHRAKFMHYQALTLWSPHTDSESEYARVAAAVAVKEGWTT